MKKYDYLRDHLPLLQSRGWLTTVQLYNLYEQSTNPTIRNAIPSFRDDKKRACQWVLDRLREMEDKNLILRRNETGRHKEYHIAGSK